MVKRKVMIGAVAAALTLGGTAALASGAGTTGSSGASSSPAAVNASASAASKTMISKAQAKQIALKAQKGKVDDIELKTRNGKAYYEVDIDRQSGDVDVWVDAYTGSILKVVSDDDSEDSDDRGSDKSTSGTASSKVKVTAAQAGAIAVKHVGGGKVTDSDLDREDGRYVYEIEIRTANGEADVTVDANTGRVLESHVDNDNDDDDDDN
ncbi:PepSY domain-containing protein [Saccharibacillus alkalitolerans]|uniref:PepSY domain-containing protein n=1 Tax=Saccharibacillus alkalitolerans TaxID=2705290 RepID=A0ABX0FC20_9BACL|nr:PepSY domain-containing protein [Saccharibacillus alkalitolerans]NGZ77584.1 PepSY domain-containing protein [Saccharibacillus alkalitolerans]